MLSICKTFSFGAAHQLPNYQGNCANLHGHRWQLEVEIKMLEEEGLELGVYKGMIMDFKVLKEDIEEAVIKKLDHQFINNILENPTAENMILWIKKQLEKLFSMRGLFRIRLYESEDSYVEWRIEDETN